MDSDNIVFVMAGVGLLFLTGFLIAIVKETWEWFGWFHWVIFPFISAAIVAIWFFGIVFFIGGIVEN